MVFHRFSIGFRWRFAQVWFRSGWTMKDPKVHVALGFRRLETSLPPEISAFESWGGPIEAIQQLKIS